MATVGPVGDRSSDPLRPSALFPVMIRKDTGPLGVVMQPRQLPQEASWKGGPR